MSLKAPREQGVAVPARDAVAYDGAVDDLVAESVRHERRLIAEGGAETAAVDFLEAEKIGVEICTRAYERRVVDAPVRLCAVLDVERGDTQHVVDSE